LDGDEIDVGNTINAADIGRADISVYLRAKLGTHDRTASRY
jgi:hypothetical protein